MAISKTKTWVDGEVFFAADLNAEFDTIFDGQQSIGWPASETKDLDGNNFILDSDGDMILVSSTDDRYDLQLNSISIFRVEANPTGSSPIVAHNGFTLLTAIDGNQPAIQATGSSDSNVDIELTPKGSGVVSIDSVLAFSHDDAVLAYDVFGT